MGCILFELVIDKPAFGDEIQLRKYSTSRIRPEIPVAEVHEVWNTELKDDILALLEINPNDRPTSHRCKIRFTVNRTISVGDSFLERKQYDKAIEVYKSALGSHPDMQKVVYKRLGDCYRAAANYEAAAENYMKGTGAILSDRSVSDNLEDALSAGEMGSGLTIETYKLAIKMDPNNAVLWRLAGDAYLIDRQYNGAITMYRKALKKGSVEYSVYEKLGIAYSATGDLDRSLKAYNVAIKKNPMPSPVLFEARNHAAEKRTKAMDSTTRKMKMKRLVSLATGKGRGGGVSSGEESDYDTQFTDTDDEIPENFTVLRMASTMKRIVEGS